MKYYIQHKGFQGNCLTWWRAGGCGYTCNLNEAGKFPAGEAKRIERGRPTEDTAWPCQLIDGIAVRHVTDGALRDIPRPTETNNAAR